RAVGNHHVVANAAVVRHVAGGHQVAVAADAGGTIFLFGAAVDRHRFANHVVVADLDARRAAAVAQVLRFAADDNARMDFVVASDGHVTSDLHVANKSRAAADPDVGPDRAERTDFDAVG